MPEGRCDQCLWNSSTDNRSTCSSCSQYLVTRTRELNDELEQLRSMKDEFKSMKDELKSMKDKESRLAFLRLHYDLDLAEEIPKDFDVGIVVNNEDDKVVFAHKVVLAIRSSVFRRMFATTMLESESGFIRIDDATLPVIRAVIRFCYTAEIDFTPEVTADEVLRVAHKYAIGFLQQTCDEVLAKTIDHVNLPSRLALAKKFEANRLKEEGLKYLKEHFDDVIAAVHDELF